MRTCLVPLVLAAAFLPASAPARADSLLLSFLLGENEIPPVQTPGYGFAVLYVPEDRSFLFYYVEFSDLLSTARNAHIHAGPAGSVGPVLFGLTGVPRATSGWFAGILTAADFTPGGGIPSYEAALDAMRTGGTYINVHSVGFSNGEIRGQTYLYEKP